MNLGEIAKVFVQGVIWIGLATALFAPGRTTTNAIKATFGGANSLLHTAETG